MLIKVNRNWNRVSSLIPALHIRRNALGKYIGFTFAWLIIYIDHLKWLKGIHFGGKKNVKGTTHRTNKD